MKCLECVLGSAHILTLTKILKKALPCFCMYVCSGRSIFLRDIYIYIINVPIIPSEDIGWLDGTMNGWIYFFGQSINISTTTTVANY